ncbi:MAG: 4'-phosphopantetheinyl transferase superfamily protein [Bacteroidaceae bacterium]|nr:4'-phosphopantetheinyl transferase superfamily protein [Bacteroidaceae bacterium]
MPLFQHRSFDGGKGIVAIWRIGESEEALVEPLADGDVLLEEARGRFKAAGRRIEWLSVRRLMHELGITSPIAYLPSGRPYLEDDERHISISHTRGYAAVALHEDYPIGLDIEQRTDKVCRVKDKFLSHEEKLFLPSEKKNVEALLIIWTAKEALFKLVDREGIDFGNHFHVLPFDVEEEGSLVAHETFTGKQTHFGCTYQIYQDFVLTLAQRVR